MKNAMLLRALLAAALVTLSAGAATQNITHDPSLLLGRAGTKQLSCADDGVTSVCGDCQTVVACKDGANGAELKTCEAGEYCVEDATEAEAKCKSDLTGYDLAGPCECTAANVHECDPYDITQRRMCSGPGDPGLVLTCPNGQFCNDPDDTSASATCGEKPPPENCGKNGYFIHNCPECTSYGTCFGTQVVDGIDYCEEGQVFDPTQGNCVTPPLQPCKGGCVDGFCASPEDSSVRHICDHGTLISPLTCSGDKKFVNYLDGSCTSRQDMVHPLTKCDLGTKPEVDPSTDPDTASPSSSCTESTVYKIWPDPKNCKKYYRCMPTDSNTYKMVQGKCPGKQRFNPDINRCDLKENVTCSN